MTTIPALPEPAGPDERKQRFYVEMAAAFEFMALYHSLPKDKQRELREVIQSFAVHASTAARPD